jgi:hypothetical protein
MTAYPGLNANPDDAGPIVRRPLGLPITAYLFMYNWKTNKPNIVTHQIIVTLIVLIDLLLLCVKFISV